MTDSCAQLAPYRAPKWLPGVRNLYEFDDLVTGSLPGWLNWLSQRPLHYFDQLSGHREAGKGGAGRERDLGEPAFP
jgi:hypothetical protein